MFSLRGYLDTTDMPFERLVACLKTLSGQDPSAHADGNAVTVCFVGTISDALKGRQRFTLYDYKSSDRIRIGGLVLLDVDMLKDTLTRALKDVTPSPYCAEYTYPNPPPRYHQWP
jgi:hypothetical protein